MITATLVIVVETVNIYNASWVPFKQDEAGNNIFLYNPYQNELIKVYTVLPPPSDPQPLSSDTREVINLIIMKLVDNIKSFEDMMSCNYMNSLGRVAK